MYHIKKNLVFLVLVFYINILINTSFAHEVDKENVIIPFNPILHPEKCGRDKVVGSSSICDQDLILSTPEKVR
jgi:hypothetical protein